MEAGVPRFAERRQGQRKDSLTLANKVRTAQAELKRRLKDGRVDPIALFDGRDEMWSEFVKELKIGVVLRAVPRFGAGTVSELLAELGLRHEDRLKNFGPEVSRQVAFYIGVIQGREA